MAVLFVVVQGWGYSFCGKWSLCASCLTWLQGSFNGLLTCTVFWSCKIGHWQELIIYMSFLRNIFCLIAWAYCLTKTCRMWWKWDFEASTKEQKRKPRWKGCMQLWQAVTASVSKLITKNFYNKLEINYHCFRASIQINFKEGFVAAEVHDIKDYMN